MATGALGTGIHIPGIVYIVHVGYPYGLTSFAQQSGYGSHSRELSTSIMVAGTGCTSTSCTSSVLVPGLAGIYNIKQANKEVLTAFLQSSSCRRAMLAWYMNRQQQGTSCKDTNSALCNCCAVQVQQAWERTRLPAEGPEEPEGPEGQQDTAEPSRSQAIAQKLAETAQLDIQLFWAMDRLQKGCVYCQLTTAILEGPGEQEQLLL